MGDVGKYMIVCEETRHSSKDLKEKHALSKMVSQGNNRQERQEGHLKSIERFILTFVGCEGKV